MELQKPLRLLLICILALGIAGCTSSQGPPGNSTTQIPTAPPTTTSDCTRHADCVPAECCHPSSCTAAAVKHPCNLMCTAGCEGPLDCGAGSCGCVNGKCRVIPASSASTAPRRLTTIIIKASPGRYSPIMSSTPGIGLEPVTTGFAAQNATFTWNATYGKFLSWNPPDFKITPLGDSASNHGEKLYWSFIDQPPSADTPVLITVTATETGSGQLLGSSSVILAWEGNYSVTVKKIE